MPVDAQALRHLVCDEEHRHFAAERIDRFGNLLGGGFVQAAGGLVEDEDARTLEQSPGDGHALALPAGQADAALANLRLVAAYLVVALVLVRLCRSMYNPARKAKTTQPAVTEPGLLATVWNELVGLFVDDGLLAIGVLVWVALAWGAEATHAVPTSLDALALALGLCAVLSLSAVRRAKA